MVEQKPDMSQLFPNEERRSLVERFIEDLSTRPGIEKVVSVDIGEGQPHQRVFVMTEGTDEWGVPTSAEMDEVLLAQFQTCRTKKERELLGHTPAVTESLFNEDRQVVDTLIGKEVHVLWQKPETQ